MQIIKSLPYLTTDFLLSLFCDLKNPRDKIKNIVKKKELINIKQGLYILDELYSKKHSQEVLAGMIYWPSVISFEYALSYHNFIPEKVEQVKSICFKKNKKFQTQVGVFVYKFINKNLYSIGTDYIQTALGNFFIATPEKAVLDLAYFTKINNQDIAKML